MSNRIKVLMTKPGIDGHWRGAIVVSTALRDAGMEVIFAGNQTPKEIAESALQEDVDVVGMSILSAGYMKLVPETLRLLKEKRVNALVLVGGTIPKEDIQPLKQMGVDEVFTPGTPLDHIVRFVHSRVGKQDGTKNN